MNMPSHLALDAPSDIDFGNALNHLKNTWGTKSVRLSVLGPIAHRHQTHAGGFKQARSSGTLSLLCLAPYLCLTIKIWISL